MCIYGVSSVQLPGFEADSPRYILISEQEQTLVLSREINHWMKLLILALKMEQTLLHLTMWSPYREQKTT